MNLQAFRALVPKNFQNSAKIRYFNRYYSNNIIPRRTDVLKTCSKLATDKLSQQLKPSNDIIPERFNIGLMDFNSGISSYL